MGQPYAAVLPPGATLETIQPGSCDERERAGLLPVRPRGYPKFFETETFVSYVLKHCQHGQTEIYANPEGGKIIAVLDWHSKEVPGWGMHRATLEFRTAVEWKEWITINKKTLTQEEFLIFLEENRADIITPSAASIVEACNNLQVTTEATFSSRLNLADGTTAVAYSENNKAGQVKVPAEITLQLSPFQGIKPWKVVTKIYTRIKSQKLSFQIVLDRPYAIIESTMISQSKIIEEQTNIKVFYGIPSGALI